MVNLSMNTMCMVVQWISIYKKKHVCVCVCVQKPHYGDCFKVTLEKVKLVSYFSQCAFMGNIWTYKFYLLKCLEIISNCGLLIFVFRRFVKMYYWMSELECSFETY